MRRLLLSLFGLMVGGCTTQHGTPAAIVTINGLTFRKDERMVISHPNPKVVGIDWTGCPIAVRFFPVRKVVRRNGESTEAAFLRVAKKFRTQHIKVGSRPDGADYTVTRIGRKTLVAYPFKGDDANDPGFDAGVLYDGERGVAIAYPRGVLPASGDICAEKLTDWMENVKLEDKPSTSGVESPQTPAQKVTPGK